MEESAEIPITRGVFVRVTTDRLDAEGVPEGAEAFTLWRRRDHETLWVTMCGGDYVELDQSEFVVTHAAICPRGVVLPSLNGGWFTIRPFSTRQRETVEHDTTLIQRWGRRPSAEDFVGQVNLVPADGNSTGFTVLWDRQRQLKLVYFLDLPDRITGGFPDRTSLDWPDRDLEITSTVTVDSSRGFYAKKSAELDITTRNPGGDRREVSAHLIVPGYACDEASRYLVDLFPAVSADDLDFA